jgi:transcriptional regulator with XRE-family HTH domain
MFKKNFIRLCSSVGESPSSVCKKIGITSAAFSQWDDKTIPRKVTQQRIADYFGITVEELLADEPATSVHVNNGIIGNQNTHNVVSVGGAADLGEIETEIVNICKKLDIKRKNALLTRAYELLDENK